MTAAPVRVGQTVRFSVYSAIAKGTRTIVGTVTEAHPHRYRIIEKVLRSNESIDHPITVYAPFPALT